MIILLILLEAFVLFNIKTGKKNAKKIFVLLSFTQLFIISAFRGVNIGVDTKTYISYFYNIRFIDFTNLKNIPLEKGYVLLNYFLHFFSHSGMILLIVVSFITIGLIMAFIYKHSQIIWLSVYLFITLMYFYSSMNIMRQYLAISILLFGITYVRKQKFIPFLVTVILASLFHFTSIVFIIVYLFPRIKFNYKNIIFTFVLGIGIFFFLEPILFFLIKTFPQYSGYISYFESNKIGSILNFLMIFIVFMFSLIFLKRKKINISVDNNGNFGISNENVNEGAAIYTSEDKLLIYIILTAVIISLLSIRMSILGRVTDYFSIFLIIYIPNFIMKIKYGKLRSLVVLAIMLSSMLYNLIIFLYKPEWYGVTPYSFW
ncbi:EpsG family protein [Paenibacillus sophorae]|nr:EpsG family protein [Paenibacillus sophorae]QWU15125.1 EpsG family protein [Paenibacillus sophorae]